MGFCINSLQLLERGMRIDLRSGEPGMTEQSFQTFYSCVMIQHRRSKCMPQDVWTFLFLEPLVGFEPTTPRLQITCSGQLS